MRHPALDIGPPMSPGVPPPAGQNTRAASSFDTMIYHRQLEERAALHNNGPTIHYTGVKKMKPGFLCGIA